MVNKMLKAAAQFIPDMPLPRFFCVRAQPAQGKTTIALIVNVQGERKEFPAVVDSENPRLSDVLALFPDVDLDEWGPWVRTAVTTVRLPSDWKLECTPKDGGFLLELDVYGGKKPQHFEKFFTVSEMQLREMIEIVDWAKDAWTMNTILQKGQAPS